MGGGGTVGDHTAGDLHRTYNSMRWSSYRGSSCYTSSPSCLPSFRHHQWHHAVTFLDRLTWHSTVSN